MRDILGDGKSDTFVVRAPNIRGKAIIVWENGNSFQVVTPDIFYPTEDTAIIKFSEPPQENQYGYRF